MISIRLITFAAMSCLLSTSCLCAGNPEGQWKKLHQAAIDQADQGHYAEAEAGFRLAIAVAKKAENDLWESISSSLLSVTLYCEGRLDEAEGVANRALASQEKLLVKENEYVAMNCDTLARILYHRKDFDLAEKFCRRALSICEKKYGENHLSVAENTGMLAAIYSARGEYSKAIPFAERSVSIQEKVIPEEDFSFLMSVTNLAIYYSYAGKEEKAAPVFQRAVVLDEKVYGKDDLKLLDILRPYSHTLIRLGRIDEANAMQARIDRLNKLAIESACKAASLPSGEK